MLLCYFVLFLVVNCSFVDFNLKSTIVESNNTVVDVGLFTSTNVQVSGVKEVQFSMRDVGASLVELKRNWMLNSTQFDADKYPNGPFSSFSANDRPQLGSLVVDSVLPFNTGGSTWTLPSELNLFTSLTKL